MTVRCACGKVYDARRANLTNGSTKSCGCRRKRQTDLRLVGKQFGLWTVTGTQGSWSRVTCACGAASRVLTMNLEQGKSKGCANCRYTRASGFAHPSALSLAEVKARLSAHLPYTFPHVDAEWQGSKSVLTVRCPRHGDGKRYTDGGRFQGGLCYQCGSEGRGEAGRSAKELDLHAFLEQFGRVDHGYIEPAGVWEYDMVMPDRRVVVEFNGLYWHSFPIRKRGFHLHKRLFAEARGYRMISIWEDLWDDPQARLRVERYLRRIMEGSPARVGARSLIVDRVDRRAGDAFHAQHHIQGASPSAAASHFALTDKDGATLAVAAFDRYGVLHRYTVGGAAVLGGLERLCAAFFRTGAAPRVTTYCDRDLFEGGVYRQAGFECAGRTIQLAYAHGGKRYRREKFMKRKLPKLFGASADMSMTETQICAAHGVRAVWNSGVDKWVLHGPA